MTLNDFKDELFETLNEKDISMSIADIDADDRNNTFKIKMSDGSVFEIECREAT